MIPSQQRRKNRTKPQLPSLTSSDVFRSLGRLGCKPIRQHGRNVMLEAPNGQRSPMPQHGKHVIGIGLLLKALRALGIKQRDFYANL